MWCFCTFIEIKDDLKSGRRKSGTLERFDAKESAKSKIKIDAQNYRQSFDPTKQGAHFFI